MINELIFAFWVFLPAGVANMAPIFAGKLPGLRELNYPIDGYGNFHGKRILGDHKTIRGVVSGVILAMIVAVILQWIAQQNSFISAVIPQAFMQVNPLLFGGLIGLGALVGDSVKSFFKRQVGVPSGKSWFPFDQVDYIIGGIVFSLFVIILPIFLYVWIGILYFGLHLLVSYIGYALKLKDAPI